MINLSNFYPKTVYFCNCLKKVMEKCEKGCSLQELCNQINDGDTDDNIIYCAKCGDTKQDVVLSCCGHIPMTTFVIQNTANNACVMQVTDRHFCLSCIKKYLRKNYYKFLSKVDI